MSPLQALLHRALGTLGRSLRPLPPAVLIAALTLPVDRPVQAARLTDAKPGQTLAQVLAGSDLAAGDFLAGIVAAERRDITTAADHMLKVLERAPEDVQILRQAFLLTASDGRHEIAVDLARRLMTRDVDLPAAKLVLAIDSFIRGDLARSDELLAALPDQGVEGLLERLMRPWVRLAEDSIEAAIAAAGPPPGDPGVAVLRQIHLALMNDVAGRMDEAGALFEEALAAESQPSLRLVWLIGNHFERAGQSGRALELYRAFFERNEGSTVIEPLIERAEASRLPEPVVADPRDGLAEVLFNISGYLSRERGRDMALLMAQQSLLLRPDSEITLVLLGEIMQEQGRGRAAIKAYRRVPVDSPFAWSARLRIADQLEELGNYEAASAELEELAKMRPDSFEPLFRLGNLLRVQERFEEAVVAYDRAVERIGEIEPRHWTLLYFRGIALERSDQWPRAEADFLRALELQPEQPYVMNYLAYSWVEQRENLDRAKAMLRRAVELRPTDGYIVDSLGWVYYRLGDYEEAVEQLERAVELRPQDPVINDHLGDAYWQVGRRYEARFQWRRALSLEPDEELEPVIERKLDEGLVEPARDI